MKVHYPKLYNMAHLFTFNAFTDFKGSNNYILFGCALLPNKKTCRALVNYILLSTSLSHVLMRKPSLRIPFRGMGGRYAKRLAILRSALVCKPEVL